MLVLGFWRFACLVADWSGGLTFFNKFSFKSYSIHSRIRIWFFLPNATHGFRAFQTTWPSGTAIGQNNPLWTGSGSRSDNHPTRPSTHGQTNAKRSCHSLSGWGVRATAVVQHAWQRPNAGRAFMSVYHPTTFDSAGRDTWGYCTTGGI